MIDFVRKLAWPCTLAVILLAPYARAQQDPERSERARLVYTSAPLEVVPGGSVEDALRLYNEWGGGPGDLIPADVMAKMYAAAGGGSKAFKSIALLIDKGLDPSQIANADGITKTKIDNAHSVQMATLREQWIDQVIVDILESKNGEWKIARSDSGNVESGMKSDLDQTFYVFKKDDRGEWVRDANADGDFIREFETRFSALDGTPSLDALDIASIEGKNRFPDPRDVTLDFSATYLETIDALRNTPGAYTYSGAVAQQMQFRSLAAIQENNERAFQQYGPGGDGEIGKLEWDSDAALKHMFGITPELVPGHAYGAAIANYLEIVKYVKKPKFETKYHLRCFDDGGLVFAMDRKSRTAKGKEYMALDADEREARNQRIVDEMFRGDTVKQRLHRLALDASADLRWLHKGKPERTSFGEADPGTPEGRDAKVFEQLARALYDVPAGTAPTAAQIKAAAAEHRQLAVEFCLETTFHTAREAFKTYRDLRFQSIGSIDGYRHIMTGVKASDWPKVRENLRTAQRITLLYSLYDLGAWRSAELIQRLQGQFKDLGWKEAAALWLRGRLQGLEAPLRNPALRAIYRDKLKKSARTLHGRVQSHVMRELGFVDLAHAEAPVRSVLRLGSLDWSPSRFARNMFWDPGSIDALAQIVRTYVTSKGDMDRVRAVIADELILALPVAGQLVSASRGGVTGLVLIAGAIKFPVVGAGLLVYSVGEAGYAIYDAEYGKPHTDNLLQAIYRGYTGPDTMVFDGAPPQFTAADERRVAELQVAIERAEQQRNPAAAKRAKVELAALNQKQGNWEEFRDDSAFGGYFTGGGAVTERHGVARSLLAGLAPIISYSPTGMIDLRARWNAERDQPRLDELQNGLDTASDAEAYLSAVDELDELLLQKTRFERAQRYLDRARGRNGKTAVPELWHKLLRDSLYPAMLEDAKRRQAIEGKSAQPNPDQFIARWLERDGDAVIQRLVDLNVLPRSALEKTEVGNFAARKKASPLPIAALQDRLTADYHRSRALYKEWQRAEERRRQQRQLRHEARLAAYEAQAAGQHVEELADHPRLRELAIARYLAARKRNAPTIAADFYVIRNNRGDRPDSKVEIHARTRITADPALYVGPYESVLRRLNRAAAEAAAKDGSIDGIPLLPPVLAALRAEVQALGPAPKDPKDEPPVVIPFVAVFAAAMPDLSRALPGTWEHLPGAGERTSHGHLMGQVLGTAVKPVVDGPASAPEPAPIASSAGTRVMIAVRPQGRRGGLGIRRAKPKWEAPNQDNAQANSYGGGRMGMGNSPHVWTTWAERPDQARYSYKIRVHGGIPAFDQTYEGRLPIARGEEVLGPGILGDQVVIAFQVPGNTAGPIRIEGEVLAHPRRGKGEALARHPFRTGLTYAPAPLEVSGNANRNSGGRVGVGVRVKGAQLGGRVAKVEAGSFTRYAMFYGKSVSVRLPNGSALPGNAKVTFRNYGRNETVSIDLAQKDRDPRPVDEQAIARYEADIAKWAASKNGESEYLPKIRQAYSTMANYCFESDLAQAGRYARLELEYAERTLKACADPQWVGFRSRDLAHDGMSLQAWLRRGAEPGRTAHLAITQRLRADQVYSLLQSAKDLANAGDGETARLLATRAGEFFMPLRDDPRLGGNLVSSFEETYGHLAKSAFEGTGDFALAQAEIDRGNDYRRLGAELRGKQFKPRTSPFKPDPKFDAGGGR